MFGLGKKDEDKEVEIKEVKEEQTAVLVSDGSENMTAEISAAVTGNTPEFEEDEPAPLTWKEAKALKRARYEEKIAHNENIKQAYVIRNKRTNQVVELRALSACHAANIIGWKLRKCQVLSVTDIESPADEPETVGSSS